MNWHRVNRQAPCPVCKHPDWCTVSDAGLILCMRVQSDRPSKNAMGGWLHSTGDRPVTVFRPPPPPAPTINATQIMCEWTAETPENALQTLAVSLGVSLPSLHSIGCAWAKPHAAWAFPMRDGYGKTIGIRLRADDGRKWAVRGSRSGIFLPSFPADRIAYITEGPTDTAACLTLGLFAIGRPSCNCGGLEIRTACRRLGVSRAVMVCDNDRPGLDGAKRVASELRMLHCFFVPPAKDIREFVRQGGTAPLIATLTKDLKWHG